MLNGFRGRQPSSNGAPFPFLCTLSNIKRVTFQFPIQNPKANNFYDIFLDFSRYPNHPSRGGGCSKIRAGDPEDINIISERPFRDLRNWGKYRRVESVNNCTGKLFVNQLKTSPSRKMNLLAFAVPGNNEIIALQRAERFSRVRFCSKRLKKTVVMKLVISCDVT